MIEYCSIWTDLTKESIGPESMAFLVFVESFLLLPNLLVEQWYSRGRLRSESASLDQNCCEEKDEQSYDVSILLSKSFELEPENEVRSGN
jgi:hypothetical protein